MYTKAAVRATSATPLPMWDVGGSGVVLLPNMASDFRDMQSGRGCCTLGGEEWDMGLGRMTETR